MGMIKQEMKTQKLGKPYRVRLRTNVANKVKKMAMKENRSIPSMLQIITVEGLVEKYKREFALAILQGRMLLPDLFPDFELTEEVKTKKNIPPELKWNIFERDNFTCQHCGSHKYLQVDHITPESIGGETVLENLQTLCQKCNLKKGDKVF